MTDHEYLQERQTLNRQARLSLIEARGIKPGVRVRTVGKPSHPDFPKGRPVIRITTGGNVVCQYFPDCAGTELEPLDPFDLIVIG